MAVGDPSPCSHASNLARSTHNIPFAQHSYRARTSETPGARRARRATMTAAFLPTSSGSASERILHGHVVAARFGGGTGKGGGMAGGARARAKTMGRFRPCNDSGGSKKKGRPAGRGARPPRTAHGSIRRRMHSHIPMNPSPRHSLVHSRRPFGSRDIPVAGAPSPPRPWTSATGPLRPLEPVETARAFPHTASPPHASRIALPRDPRTTRHAALRPCPNLPQVSKDLEEPNGRPRLLTRPAPTGGRSGCAVNWIMFRSPS